MSTLQASYERPGSAFTALAAAIGRRVEMIDGAFVVDGHVRLLAGHLVTVKPSLRIEDIGAGSSLTEDLGFDSLDLVRLASLIRDTYPEFDLREWLVGAVSQGDSVGSMATMLAETGAVRDA